jgi:hypothetical protein
VTAIRRCALPDDALLAGHRDAGAYTDCYCVDVPADVPFAHFVEAFYTTALFKVERLVLAWFASRPSTDAEARALALGTRDAFAAWSVEARADRQLLLCDYTRRTRSWLMVAPAPDGTGGTRLYFGSAVVPVHQASGRRKLGVVFAALLGFHRLYSRLLLRAARARVAVDANGAIVPGRSSR